MDKFIAVIRNPDAAQEEYTRHVRKLEFLIVGIIAIIFSIFLAVLAMASETSSTVSDPDIKQIRITWMDDNTKTDDFQWLLFVRGESEEFGDPEVTIPIGEASFEDPEYSSSSALIITGPPGGTVKKYFALKAQKGSGEATKTSEFSKEVALTFDIPMAAPYSVIIQVVVAPEH